MLVDGLVDFQAFHSFIRSYFVRSSAMHHTLTLTLGGIRLQVRLCPRFHVQTSAAINNAPAPDS